MVAPGRHVALLRGVNVGGKNKLPMAQLAKLFVAAGCHDVRTYIQSGNVVFSAPPALAKKIPDLVSKEVARKFRFQSAVVVRTAAELARVAAQNPFLKAGKDPASLHVAFLADAPPRARLAALDPDRSPGDSFATTRQEIYLHLPNGVARTKLTNAYLDSKLETTSTARNWRTVLKLLEMAQATG